MRIKVYLRIASTSRGHRVVATTKPSYEPVRDQHGDALPTISFAIRLDLPSDAFTISTLPGEVAVPATVLKPIVETIEVEA